MGDVDNNDKIIFFYGRIDFFDTRSHDVRSARNKLYCAHVDRNGFQDVLLQEHFQVRYKFSVVVKEEGLFVAYDELVFSGVNEEELVFFVKEIRFAKARVDFFV